MITFAAIKAGLQSIPEMTRVAVYPISEDSRVGVPTQHVRVTPSGGYGDQLEGVLVNQEWQIRVVGRTGDYESAESLAWILDRHILGWSGTQVGGVRVVAIQRSGSPPTVLLTDDAQRTHFVCSYLLDVE